MKKQITLYTDTAKQLRKIAVLYSFCKPINGDPGVHFRQLRGYHLPRHLGDYAVSFGPAFSKTKQQLADQQLGSVKYERATLRFSITKSYPGKVFYTDTDPLDIYKQNPEQNRTRFPFGSPFPNEAEYFDSDLDLDKWDKIKQERNINLKEYDGKGDYVLICCNRGECGYSSKGLNAADWAIETATEVMKHTDRPIIIRTHCAVGYDTFVSDRKRLHEFSKYPYHKNKITLHSPSRSGWFEYPELDKVSAEAYCVITYVSNAAAAAIIEGTPVYSLGEWSYTYSMNPGPLSSIENIDINSMYSLRENWLHHYANNHYTNEELSSGEYWSKARKKILELQ